MLSRMSHFISRRKNILSSPYLSATEKISILTSCHALAEDILQKKVEAREKEYLLKMGNYHISIPIVADRVQANKDKQFLAQVARETFLGPVIFN